MQAAWGRGGCSESQDAAVSAKYRRLSVRTKTHHGQWQVIDAAAKGIGQGQRDLHRRWIGVVALAYVQYAGKAVVIAQIQVIEAELAEGPASGSAESICVDLTKSV